jgi:hypothetical protein
VIIKKVVRTSISQRCTLENRLSGEAIKKNRSFKVAHRGIQVMLIVVDVESDTNDEWSSWDPSWVSVKYCC